MDTYKVHLRDDMAVDVKADDLEQKLDGSLYMYDEEEAAVAIFPSGMWKAAILAHKEEKTE